MKRELMIATTVSVFLSAASLRAQEPASWLSTGGFAWRASPPLFAPLQRERDELLSVKDPSIVQYDGKWHLFVTVRGRERSHQIEYLTFADWDRPQEADRTLLAMHPGFFCAPQVFYSTPHKKWYLICQASDEAWDPKYGAAFSTTETIGDPASWSPLQPMEHRSADGKRGLDFWVICDAAKAHLFFTTNDGRMWREETTLEAFPLGWSEPELALQGDIFEASHTYRIQGEERYLTIIEAQNGHGWRYYKAYTATALDGEWTPLAATKDHAFANMLNVQPTGERWTESISHGELLRVGNSERLEIDPRNLQMVFQGVMEADRQGKKYGEIPWRLGLLTQQRE